MKSASNRWQRLFMFSVGIAVKNRSYPKWFCLIICTSLIAVALKLQSSVWAQGQDRSTLPAGYYVYMGPEPFRTAPQAFSINSSGGVIWQDAGKLEQPIKPSLSQKQSVSKPPTTASKPKPSVKPVKQWESYIYPVINWKAHPITTIPGGIAQISTTFDSKRAAWGAGLKCKLTLFKVSRPPNSMTVHLLDANGFTLAEIHISDFHPVPGTALLEASGDAVLAESDYQLARDYLVQ